MCSFTAQPIAPCFSDYLAAKFSTTCCANVRRRKNRRCFQNMNKPCSPSAERNKEPILNVLKEELSSQQSVLEIGSGTGQHACYFSAALPHILWQPTELKENIPAIQQWMQEQHCSNLLEPKILNVDDQPWPYQNIDTCFTCNTFHIVGQSSVKSIFNGCKSVLHESGKLCVYGPFALKGKHTSESNEHFDHQLRASNPNSGIRDLFVLDDIAQQHGFKPHRKLAMPANNFFVVWEIE